MKNYLPNQNTIIAKEDFVEKAKEILSKIQQSPSLRVMIQITKKERIDANYALAYERQQFVIVEPNGKKDAAQLYGNWDEALSYAKRLVTQQESPAESNNIVVTHYHESLT